MSSQKKRASSPQLKLPLPEWEGPSRLYAPSNITHRHSPLIKSPRRKSLVKKLEIASRLTPPKPTQVTLQYDQVLFILEPTGIARSLARKRVTVIDYPDGRLAIRYNGVDLPYRTFDKRPQINQAAIVENKRLGPILAYIAEQQKQLDMSRSSKAPRRRGQKNHMFKVG